VIYNGCFLQRITFVFKRKEVKGERRKLHDGELHYLYSFPSVIRMMKSRGMKWAGHVSLMEKMRMHTTFNLESLKGTDLLEELSV
jgi:hypothetical protein